MTQRNDEGYSGRSTSADSAKRWGWMRQWNRCLIPALLAFITAGWSLEAQAAEPFHVCVNPAGLMKVVSSPDECGKNETHHNLSPDATPEFLALQGKVAQLEIQVASLQEEVAALSDVLGQALPPKVFLPEGMTVAEGDPGDPGGDYTQVDVTLTLSKPAPYPVVVEVSNDAGLATRQAQFPLGETEATLSWFFSRDHQPEPDLEAVLYVSYTNVEIGSGEMLLVIENDDFPAVVPATRFLTTYERPDFSQCVPINSWPVVAEDWDEIMQVDYVTTALSAEAGSDFVYSQGTITFTNDGGQLCAYIPIIDDDEAEPEETFIVGFYNPLNVYLPSGNSTYVTIRDNDLVFDVAEMTVEEGNAGDDPYTWLTLEITLDQPAPSNQSFYFWPRRLEPEEAIVADPSVGTYDVKSSTVSVSIGEGATSGTANIAIYGDTLPEADERFLVRVVNSSGGALAPDGSSYLDVYAWILDDD